MSSRSRRIVLCIALLPASTPLCAQTQSDPAARQQAQLRDAIAEPECAVDPVQRDTIVVCGAVTGEETRRVMSVLPAPVQSDRIRMQGLNDPPCWIESRGAACMRGGYAPPPVVLIDLDQFPDALPPEEARAVQRVEVPE